MRQFMRGSNWLVAAAMVASACSSGDEGGSYPGETNNTDAPVAVASTQAPLELVCELVDLDLVVLLFGDGVGTPDGDGDSCVVATGTAAGNLTVQTFSDTELDALRLRLRDDPAVHVYRRQGEPMEGATVEYVREATGVWLLGDRSAVVVTTDGCCVEAQRDALRRLVYNLL